MYVLARSTEKATFYKEFHFTNFVVVVVSNKKKRNVSLFLFIEQTFKYSRRSRITV